MMQPEFVRLMERLANGTSGKEPPAPKRLEIWYERFRNMPAAVFSQAVERLIDRSEGRFPGLASIHSAVNEVINELEHRAELQRLEDARREYEKHPVGVRYLGDSLSICMSAPYTSPEDYFGIMADMEKRYPGFGWQQEASRCKERRQRLHVPAIRRGAAEQIGGAIERVFGELVDAVATQGAPGGTRAHISLPR